MAERWKRGDYARFGVGEGQVRIMALYEGYAMVRFAGGEPFVEKVKNLRRPEGWEAPTARSAPIQRPRQAREPHALTKAKRVVKERSGGLCEAGTPACPPMPHQAHHVHHVAGRTDHRPQSLLHVCHPAHDFIHAEPEMSRLRGWMVLRLGSDDIRSTKPSRG